MLKIPDVVVKTKKKTRYGNKEKITKKHRKIKKK